jgi:hypothetical protein
MPRRRTLPFVASVLAALVAFHAAMVFLVNMPSDPINSAPGSQVEKCFSAGSYLGGNFA